MGGLGTILRMLVYDAGRVANIGEIPDITPRQRLLALEQTALDGEAEQLRAALEAELVTQALAVGLDGLHAHGQLVGGFLVRVPLRQQPEHLGLTPTQRPGVPR